MSLFYTFYNCVTFGKKMKKHSSLSILLVVNFSSLMKKITGTCVCRIDAETLIPETTDEDVAVV